MSLVELSHITKQFGGTLALDRVSLSIRKGECHALMGENGAGKSTFLKTILGQIPPLGGEVVLGASLQIGYFAQAHEGLDPSNTVLDEILKAAPGMLPYQGREYLGKYLFSGDDFFKTVSMLSGGERGRLALAKLAMQDTNLLLLDEPTNHLDIPSQEVLQAVLDAYQGTILLVTHDRYLVDALATQVWALERGGMRVFEGSYAEFLADREKESAAEQEAARPQGERGWSRDVEAERARKAEKRAQAARAKRQAELEEQINSLEIELQRLSSAIESASRQAQLDRVQSLGIEYARVEVELNRKLDEWGSHE